MGIRFFWSAIPGMEDRGHELWNHGNREQKYSLIPRLKYSLGMRSMLMQVGKAVHHMFCCILHQAVISKLGWNMYHHSSEFVRSASQNSTELRIP